MKPLVSICILTFNHEKFIRECLDGIINQQCNFSFEILIHDDASTDNTQKIIKEYQINYPEMVKPILQTENKFSKGIKVNTVYNFSRALGKYIALCEGDDYWTDIGKLQRQVDFLENHLEYAMSAENGLIVHSDSRSNMVFNSSISEITDISIEILLGKRPFPTASVLFRQEILEDKFYEQNLQGGDTILWAWISTKGKISFNPIVSSVYRRGVHGIVEGTHALEWALKMKTWNQDLLKVVQDQLGKKMIQTRIFKEFKFSFLQSLQKRNLQHALASLKECAKAKPLDSVLMVMLSPLYIAKNILTQNKKQF